MLYLMNLACLVSGSLMIPVVFVELIDKPEFLGMSEFGTLLIFPQKIQ